MHISVHISAGNDDDGNEDDAAGNGDDGNEDDTAGNDDDGNEDDDDNGVSASAMLIIGGDVGSDFPSGADEMVGGAGGRGGTPLFVFPLLCGNPTAKVP